MNRLPTLILSVEANTAGVYRGLELAVGIGICRGVVTIQIHDPFISNLSKMSIPREGTSSGSRSEMIHTLRFVLMYCLLRLHRCGSYRDACKLAEEEFNSAQV